MQLTRERIRRAVKLDLVLIDEIRKRDLMNDPIAGIRVDLGEGEKVILQDVRAPEGGDPAVALVLVRGGVEVGVPIRKEHAHRIAAAVWMAASVDGAGGVRVDLNDGRATLGVRRDGVLLHLGLVAQNGAQVTVDLRGERDARRLVGALFTIWEVFRAQELIHGR